MNSRHTLLAASALVLSAGLILTACGPQKTAASAPAAAPATGAPIDSLPLAQGAPAQARYAPAASQLPEVAPIKLASAGTVREPYSYLDDAYDLGETFADSPPDYTVDYDGVSPWVWRSQTGAYRVVEQLPSGERDYYYHAGADAPFLVRDPNYAYAYDGGQLVEVYDGAGRPVEYDVAERDASIAASYLARARRLYDAAVHQQRRAAYAADWQAHRDIVLAAQRDWQAQQQRNTDWKNWHEQHIQQIQDRPQYQAREQERSQRQAYAAGIGAAVAGAAVAGAAIQHHDDQLAQRAQAGQMRQQQAQATDQARRDRARQDQTRQDQARAQQAQAEQNKADQLRQHDQQMQADNARRQADQQHQHQMQAQNAQRQGDQQRQHAQAQNTQHEQQRQQQMQTQTAQHDQQRQQADQARQHADQARQQAQHAHVQQAQAEQAHRVVTDSHPKPQPPHPDDHHDDHH